MDYILYANGGSGNHGCEAIIRGTYALLGDGMQVISQSPGEDRKYKIDDIAKIYPAVTGKPDRIEWLKAYLHLKLHGDFSNMDGIAYLPAIHNARGRAEIAMSAGGDNYCYGNTDFYAYLHRAYRKAGFKTALWGCSVEPSVVKEKTVSEDLRNYTLIVARESISYEAILQVNENTFLAPDPAFYMSRKRCVLPEHFGVKKVIGINASPMIFANEMKKGITYQNYLNLIRFILKETDCQVALLPHVVWQQNDDRQVLRTLYKELGSQERIILIDDHSAPELKYIISNCSVLIGARTHATIAAYSSGVPTLAVGYSVKARGIARDLFGTEENYVIPVQELKESMQLVQAAKIILDKHNRIRRYLQETLPKYMEGMNPVITEIEKISERV